MKTYRLDESALTGKESKADHPCEGVVAVKRKCFPPLQKRSWHQSASWWETSNYPLFLLSFTGVAYSALHPGRLLLHFSLVVHSSFRFRYGGGPGWRALWWSEVEEKSSTTMSELTPNLPPEDEEEEVEEVVEMVGMVGSNVEVDHTPLQDQLARNKECKLLMQENTWLMGSDICPNQKLVCWTKVHEISFPWKESPLVICLDKNISWHLKYFPTEITCIPMLPLQTKYWILTRDF